jgi:hypothetical protein
MLIIKIITLFLFSEWVENYNKMNKYTHETKFNVYRSLMCLYFTVHGLQIVITEGNSAYNNNFDYQNDEIRTLQEWVASYLILDLEKLIMMGNKRIDLYIHHIWCLISLLITQFYDRYGYLSVLIFLTESISIVSGFDNMYLEDNEKYNSMLCKKYRKHIIRYIRTPIWISVIIIIFIYKKEMPNILFWNGLLTSIVMLCLDRYWEKRCDKVINDYIK